MKKTTLPLSKSPSQNGLNGKNRPKIKLFVSHSMSACNEDSVLLFCELAKKAGFEPVLATGASPRPPMEKIQAMLAECRSFAALIQPPNYGEACSMWLPAEIGMAIGKGLPTIALCETHLMPAAKSLLAANLSLLDIGQGQLFGQKAKFPSCCCNSAIKSFRGRRTLNQKLQRLKCCRPVLMNAFNGNGIPSKPWQTIRLSTFCGPKTAQLTRRSLLTRERRHSNCCSNSRLHRI